MIRALLLAASAAIALAVACTSPVPEPSGPAVPTGAPAPTGQPSGAPVETDAPPSGIVEDITDPAGDLLTPAVQPGIPGLYLPAGTRVRGTDHYAFIQADFACDELVDVLGAGEWSASDPISPPLPSPDPSAAPMPDVRLPEWVLLRWAEAAAVARMGGDESGCVAQVWRLARSAYTASGAIESEGEASGLQTLCAAGGGVAELGTMYFADDGTFYSLETRVPLEVGSHPIDQETELRVGQPGLDIETVFPLLYGGAPGGEEQPEPEVEQFFPTDLTTLTWEGTIEVANVDPLIGEIVFDDLQNERGDRLTIRTGFRCDLTPGQLTRAAESANATPGPDATPTPAPGQITVEIATGPHAGSHMASSADATCSANLFGDGSWYASYSQAEPVAGELQSLTLTVPSNGGRSEVFMFFGDDLEHDWFSTDDATAVVADTGTSATFTVSGRDAGTDFTIEFVCYDVERF